MSDRPRVYPRIQRRETHAARSVPAIVVAVVLILALAYLVTEIVLAAAGQRPLLLAPATMVQDIAKLNAVDTALLTACGVVLAILGVVLIVLALSGGRRPRHVLRNERAVVVVDNEVIASALVRTAADTADVDPDRAVASVSHRTATLTVTPSSGVPLDRDAIDSAIRGRLQEWGFTPGLRSRVRIEKAGKVGA